MHVINHVLKTNNQSTFWVTNILQLYKKMLQFLHHYTAHTIYELCCSSICYKQNPKQNIFTSLYKLRIFIGITLGAIVWSGLLPSLLSSVYNTMLISVWQEAISMGRKTVFWISPFPTVKLNIFSIFKQKAKITNKRMDEIEMFTHTCRVLLRKSLELRLLSIISICLFHYFSRCPPLSNRM